MKDAFLKSMLVFLAVIFFADCNKEKNVLPSVDQKQSIPNVANATLPRPDHIVIVVEENHTYSQVIGSSDAPYINSLVNDPNTVRFTQSYGNAYGSQVDYLDLYSGANQGAGGTGHPKNEPFTTPNLGRQLMDAGLSYSTYSQGLPYTGYNGDRYGTYVRIHNPAANWMGTGTNQIPPTTNQPFTAFPSDFTKLPTVSLVIPNLNKDMHDGTVSEGDSWLKNNLNKYIQWAKTHNSLFIFTFDEDDGKHNNRIPTFFTGAMVKGGRDTMHINHFNVLRTIEDMYGLPYAGNAASAKPITHCWK